MRILLLHHHDLDGYMAGVLVKQAFPQAESRSLNYAKDVALPSREVLSQYQKVYVVDYSLPGETMLWLQETGRLVWIDHHYSAIRQSQEMGYHQAEGLRCPPGDLICGAELTWQFFHPQTPIPRFLKLVGDYDTFRNAQTPDFSQEVLPFFYTSQLEMDALNPKRFGEPDFPLKSMEDFQKEELCQNWIAKGKIIQAYQEMYYRKIGGEYAFVRELWGLKVLCMNCPGHGSLNLKPSFRPQEHDAMLLYAYNGSHWTYGFYTDSTLHPQVDCSAIAKLYGGGGHRGAAGFCTPELLPQLLHP